MGVCALFHSPMTSKVIPRPFLAQYYLITEMSNTVTVTASCFAFTNTSQHW